MCILKVRESVTYLARLLRLSGSFGDEDRRRLRPIAGVGIESSVSVSSILDEEEIGSGDCSGDGYSETNRRCDGRLGAAF